MLKVQEATSDSLSQRVRSAWQNLNEVNCHPLRNAPEALYVLPALLQKLVGDFF